VSIVVRVEVVPVAGNSRSGRKPKPPQLKVVEGNPGKRPIPDAPKPPPIAPREPDWARVLRGGDEQVLQARRDARTEWRRVVPVLDALGLLAQVDALVLTDYAVCWARLVQCERALSTQGLLVEVWQLDKDGERLRVELRRNPHAILANQYRGQLRFHVGELGLGPSSRGRLAAGAPEGDADDDLYD
jgi:P27 family predicted phage terminase small subunit